MSTPHDSGHHEPIPSIPDITTHRARRRGRHELDRDAWYAGWTAHAEHAEGGIGIPLEFIDALRDGRRGESRTVPFGDVDVSLVLAKDGPGYVSSRTEGRTWREMARVFEEVNGHIGQGVPYIRGRDLPPFIEMMAWTIHDQPAIVRNTRGAPGSGRAKVLKLPVLAGVAALVRSALRSMRPHPAAMASGSAVHTAATAAALTTASLAVVGAAVLSTRPFLGAQSPTSQTWTFPPTQHRDRAVPPHAPRRAHSPALLKSPMPAVSQSPAVPSAPPSPSTIPSTAASVTPAPSPSSSPVATPPDPSYAPSAEPSSAYPTDLPTAFADPQSVDLAAAVYPVTDMPNQWGVASPFGSVS